MKTRDINAIILYKKSIDDQERIPEGHEYREDACSVPFRFRPEIIDIVYNEYKNTIDDNKNIKADHSVLYKVDKLVDKLTKTINEKLRGLPLH